MTAPTRCPRCNRPEPTDEIVGHEGGCMCPLCRAACWAAWGERSLCDDIARENAQVDAALLALARDVPPHLLAAMARTDRKRVVYLAHPVGAPTVEGIRANLARAKRWLWALRNATEWSICAPWIPSVEAVIDMGGDEAVERVRGLADDVAVVERCDALVGCGGRWSSGMTEERGAAAKVIDLTDLGDEPPAVEVLAAELVLRERVGR